MRVQISSDGTWTAVGADDGILAVIDRSDRVLLTRKLPGGIRDIRFSDDGSMLAASDDKGDVELGHRIDLSWTSAVWKRLQLPCKRLAFVAGRTLVAAARGGLIWTYDDDTDRWKALSTEGEDFRSLAYLEQSGHLALVATDGELFTADVSR